LFRRALLAAERHHALDESAVLRAERFAPAAFRARFLDLLSVGWRLYY